MRIAPPHARTSLGGPEQVGDVPRGSLVGKLSDHVHVALSVVLGGVATHHLEAGDLPYLVFYSSGILLDRRHSSAGAYPSMSG